MRSTPVSRAAVVMVVTASSVILIAGIRSASGLVGPAFLALMLTIAVHPLLDIARRRGWPGWVGMLLGMLTVYLILVVMAVSIIASLAKFATLLPQYADDWKELVNHASSQLGHLGAGESQQQTISGALDPAQLEDFILSILSSLSSLASSFAFLVTLLLFLSLDASAFPAKLATAAESHGAFVSCLSHFASGVRRYLVVSTVFGLIVGVIDTAALALLGVPGAIVWGLLAFITNYIPNIGFVIGLIPPAVIALLEGGPGLMVAVIVIYCVVNFVIQTVIQPRIVGDTVGLSTTITFLSMIFWAWVLGPIGALLAVPMTLLLKALLIEADPDARWLLPIISSESPKPAAEKATAGLSPPPAEA